MLKHSNKDSDIDLLYDIEPIFIQKYSGFEAFKT